MFRTEPTNVRPASVALAISAMGVQATLREDGSVYVPRGNGGIVFECDPYRDDIVRTSEWDGHRWSPLRAHYVDSPEDVAMLLI